MGTWESRVLCGVDATGSFRINQDSHPITFQSYNAGALQVEIGGVTPGSRNLFSGFGDVPGWGSQDALRITLKKPGDRAVIKGNYIGTDATGTASIPNRRGVILVQDGAGPEWIVGGPEPGAGNLISGNRHHKQKFVVSLLGVTDPDGDPISVQIMRIQGAFGRAAASGSGTSRVPARARGRGTTPLDCARRPVWSASRLSPLQPARNVAIILWSWPESEAHAGSRPLRDRQTRPRRA